MASSEVGTAVIKLTFDGKDVTAELTSLSNQMEKKGKASGSSWASAWTTAAGNLIAKGVSKVASFISDNFDYAAKRLDTLNKFPIALKNLGINADDASKAINDLSEYTLGLPTTLNDAAEKVQLFTASTGDVHKSVKIFEALNDAVVSGAQSTEVQSTAIYQWSQALARGSFDVEREYMAMVDANAAAVNQVAQRLLGTEANFNSLWDALKEGRVTVDDVINAMIDLDQNGTGALQSWHDNARDSAAGIDVAMTRLQTNMGKALVAIIEDTIGWEGLYEMINDIGDGIYEVGKTIGEFLKGIWPTVKGVFEFLLENKWLIGFIAGVATVVSTLNTVMGMSPVSLIVIAVGALIAGLILLVTHLDEVGQWFHNTFGWVGDFVGGVAKAIGDFFGGVFDGIKKGLSAVGNFFGGIFEGIKNVAVGIFNFFYSIDKAVFGAIKETFGSVKKTVGDVSKTVGSFFSGVVNTVRTVISNVISAIGSFVQGFYNTLIKPILEFLANVGIFVVAVVTRAAEGVYNFFIKPVIEFVSGLVSQVKQFISAAVAAIKGVVGAVVGWFNSYVITPIKNFVNAAVNTIRSWVTNFVNAVKSIIGSITAWVNANVITPVRNFFSGLFNAIKSAAQGAVNGVKDFFRGMRDWLSGTIETIKGFFRGLWDGITSGVRGAVEGVKNFFRGMRDWINNNLIGPVAGFFSGLWEGVKQGVRGIIGAVQEVMSTIGGIIKAPINGIIGAINGVIESINSITVPDWVPGIGGAHANFGTIPYLAQGGLVNSPTMAVIGEQGKEAVIPLEDNQDNWAGLLASAIEEEMAPRSEDRRPITVYINNHVNNKMDAEDIGRIMMQSIRRAA